MSGVKMLNFGTIDENSLKSTNTILVMALKWY